MQVVLKLLKLPACQTGIVRDGLLEKMPARLKGSDMSSSICSLAILIQGDGPGRRVQITTGIVVEAREAIDRYLETGHHHQSPS
jgi:hypothetical protein